MAIPSNSSQTEIFSKHRVPFFTGTDYPYWKTRMTCFGKNLQGIREGDEDIEVSPIKWHTKVTAIPEAKDLTKLPMEELIGSLMTYEINLANKLQEGEEKKNKSIALKATTKKEEDVEEEKPSEKDDDLALIIRKLNK
ncbi:hypothetical protein CK203_109455 [Vitis vinifera]|uniref:DUF4219 domain-containing protein n=1 Tax=Vitis vinifera TaxID=29760 RepID=A0A438CH36_VITVI|nr:hypothetical protein CK203_109455 [Vitis vinifera]